MKFTIRKTKERGKAVYILDFKPLDGKRQRRWFKTLAEAQAAKEAKAKEARKAGEDFVALSTKERNELILAHHKMKELQVSWDQLFDAWKNGKPSNNGNGNGSVTLEFAGKEFEAFLHRKNNTPSHCANGGRWVRKFSEGREQLPVSKITHDVLVKYLDDFSNVVTWNSNRDWARSFFGYCHRQGWMTQSICDKYILPKKTVKYVHREIWTVAQWEKALTFCLNEKPELLLYVVLATLCGIRPTEINRMEHRMIRLDEDIIDLPPEVTKTNQPRTIHLHATAKAWIQVAYELNSPLGADFAATDAIKQAKMKPLRDHLGFDEWPSDIMRHSFCSYYSELTKSIGATAMEAGNSEAIIKKNYKSKVTPKQCKAFWNLTPEVIKAKASQ